MIFNFESVTEATQSILTCFYRSVSLVVADCELVVVKLKKIMHSIFVFALWSNRGFADPVSILWIISPGFAVKIKSDTFSSWTF